MKLENIGFYTLSDDRVKNVSLTSNMKRCEIILTDKCNFKCPYCRGVRPDCRKDMPLDRVKNIIDIWASDNLENIRFSGGEPTLYPYIYDVIEHCKLKGIKRIALSTNGFTNIEIYKALIKYGVNDFSISLDGYNKETIKTMSGGVDAYDRIIDNIKRLSKITYVSVGMVFNDYNIDTALQSIEFANDLGVADIRILSSAQYNKALSRAVSIDNSIQRENPILKYRIDNLKNKKPVRGLCKSDYNRCGLAIDDSAVAGNYHFPCIIYLREQGNPIGKINKGMRKERYEWFLKHDTHKDNICKNNCLDVCVDYNNKYREYHKNEESDEMIEHGRNYLRVTGEPPRVFDGTATLVYTPEFLDWVERMEK